MGFLDDAKKKAEKLADEHPDQFETLSDAAIDRAGDAADKATGGKYADKTDAAQEKADDAIGR